MKTYISKAEADKARASRGFESFQAWAKANKQAQGLHEAKGNRALLDALRNEYAKYIQPYA